MVMNPNILKAREKEKRILQYTYLVEQVAQRVKSRIPDHIEYEELLSVGYIGLMEAIERYDGDKKVPFRVYAEIRVNGSMLDFLRKEDWMPRNLRQQVKEIQRAEHSLKCNGKERSDRNIAEILHLSEEEVCKVRGETQRRTMISGHVKLGNSEVQFLEECVADSTQDVLQSLVDTEGEAIVLLALQELKDKERQVLEQYFIEGMNLRQIGQSLGVTESRACQLRKSGIQKLQKLIGMRAA
jgi:RNA polymerase sigma factor for flagellar operon FliA